MANDLNSPNLDMLFQCAKDISADALDCALEISIVVEHSYKVSLRMNWITTLVLLTVERANRYNVYYNDPHPDTRTPITTKGSITIL